MILLVAYTCLRLIKLSNSINRDTLAPAEICNSHIGLASHWKAVYSGPVVVCILVASSPLSYQRCVPTSNFAHDLPGTGL